MKPIVMKIKAKGRVDRNIMHFEVQKKQRMNVFQDKTKYNRKRTKDRYIKENY